MGIVAVKTGPVTPGVSDGGFSVKALIQLIRNLVMTGKALVYPKKVRLSPDHIRGIGMEFL